MLFYTQFKSYRSGFDRLVGYEWRSPGSTLTTEYIA
nr:MAG TPA_asm: hypothetical protein [Caudoviricetes sp.]